MLCLEWTCKKTGRTKRQAQWYMDILSKAKTKAERQKLRSKTFQGIADAMADQWGRKLCPLHQQLELV